MNLCAGDKKDADEEKESKVFLIQFFLKFCLYRAFTAMFMSITAQRPSTD